MTSTLALAKQLQNRSSVQASVAAAFRLPRKGWGGSFTAKHLTSSLISMGDRDLIQVRELLSTWAAFYSGFALGRAS